MTTSQNSKTFPNVPKKANHLALLLSMSKSKLLISKKPCVKQLANPLKSLLIIHLLTMISQLLSNKILPVVQELTLLKLWHSGKNYSTQDNCKILERMTSQRVISRLENTKFLWLDIKKAYMIRIVF
jgi:hypothetical protein